MVKEKMVCIEWEDAYYNPGYYDREKPETLQPILTRTVGHLISNTKKAIVVSGDRFYSKGRPEENRHIMVIPRTMIKVVKELKEV